MFPVYHGRIGSWKGRVESTIEAFEGVIGSVDHTTFSSFTVNDAINVPTIGIANIHPLICKIIPEDIKLVSKKFCLTTGTTAFGARISTNNGFIL
jgi:hypothetical protein